MKTTSSSSSKHLKLSKSTSSLIKLKRELRKKFPKTLSKVEAQWDYKMILPVMDFVFSLIDDINPRLKKLVKKDEYILQGEDIEAKVWKLLEKCRRLK